MKKLLLLVIICLIAFEYISYSQCPPGYIASGVHFEIDKFNFHKPRTNCSARFGICIQLHLETICSPDFNPRTSMNNDKVNIAYEIKDNKLELYIPLALKDDPEFSDVDMTIFSIDSDYIFIHDSSNNLIGKLKGGDYSVSIIQNNFYIIIDIE